MINKLSEETLSGWGNIPKSHCNVAYPSQEDDIIDYAAKESLLARGKGRSYADQATNSDHTVLKMEKMNHFLSFDQDKGFLTCEAGATLDEIIQVFASRGWFPLINPGTKFVTLGGAIANDIHGKAHHVDGSFVNSVEYFTILLSDGRVLRASRTENEDLFWANFGGLGLLGVILTVCIKLRKIETTYFVQKSIVAHNLDEMLAAIDSADEQYNYSVAWIDSLATGKNFGKGVLIVGNEAKVEDLPAKLQKNPLKTGGISKLTVPFYLPSFTLNKLTVSMLNKVLYIKQKGGTGVAHYDSFFFPLDMINEWNRGYGKKGFIQYQFVVPEAGGKESIRLILDAITKSGCVPFLNVLKKFGEGQGAPLSFPMKGYTFAIDFPVTDRLREFTKKLDKMVLDAGGRLYLGKDAYLDEATFKAMYPQYKEWLEVKRKYDPKGLYSSDLARRIGLTL
ncbi:FAD-binding oxidoreductase [Fulvivirga maritima]|uniref:FAD-binding oxidoreductase n=1 Tax=Fulvivirga maritima TaxID=2904247 RepID=UPI001F3F6B7F|nr:FAD-binding oxidoreductase [Fulvivirga maritima]UII25682.1 FAD-binding oxidoreductase [Fulvivirga maritima]